jgi:hypothetical protein
MLKTTALIMLAFTAPVLAQGTAVPLPRERPAETAASSSVELPRERPSEANSEQPATPAPSSSSAEPAAPPTQAPETIKPTPPRPPIKGPDDYQVACPALMNGQVTGKAIPPIHEGQCGLQSPLSLEAVSANGRSIPFNATITTDCGMATALPAWISEVDSYLFAHDKTRIKTINVSTNYECRNVDHAKEGNLSFHSFADALDIMSFTLADGRTIDIKTGFNGTEEQGSRILRFARDSACTHFMTVLGPDADSSHQDNMHLDLACHGKNCTTRLCQ